MADANTIPEDQRNLARTLVDQTAAGQQPSSTRCPSRRPARTSPSGHQFAKGRPDGERRDRIEAEATRLSAAGGTVARRVDGPDGFWIVMHDIEGNEYCVI